jgi:protein tyrosine phosphatase
MPKIRNFVAFCAKSGISKSEKLFEKIMLLDAVSIIHSSSDANPKSCRFDDIHCVDKSRVVLQASGSDFIHANRLSVNDTREFILTQLPLAQTVEAFWQMVWQENVDVILLILTQHEWDLFAKDVELIPKR